MKTEEIHLKRGKPTAMVEDLSKISSGKCRLDTQQVEVSNYYDCCQKCQGSTSSKNLTDPKLESQKQRWQEWLLFF